MAERGKKTRKEKGQKQHKKSSHSSSPLAMVMGIASHITSLDFDKYATKNVTILNHHTQASTNVILMDGGRQSKD